MPTPQTKLVYCAAILLALLSPAMEAVETDPIERLAGWNQNPDACQRQELIEYLRHSDIRVRSAALDLLESVTGQDFGIDPWIEPTHVPPNIQQLLDTWGKLDEDLGSAERPPTPEVLSEVMLRLREADPDTQRRICLRYSRYKKAFTSAIQAELERTDLGPSEMDRLRCTLYRAQLMDCPGIDAAQIATQLTSHSRSDTLAALEQLRQADRCALPILIQFTGIAQDILVREIAVDILIEKGKLQAFHMIAPQLMTENDGNLLQIAARRAMDCSLDTKLLDFLNRCATSADEDISVAGLEALGTTSTADTIKRYEQQKLAAHALTIDQYISLLESPYWRVRNAAVNALLSTSPSLPSIRDEKLQQALLSKLQDKDETVRQSALAVIYKRNLLTIAQKELNDHALNTPSSAPFIIYQFCDLRIPLSDSLLNLLERFTPDQVEQLLDYDDRYHSVLTSSNITIGAQQVIEHLLRNPDYRVLRRLMMDIGPYCYTQNEQGATCYVDWLTSDTVSLLSERQKSLKLLLRRLNSSDRILEQAKADERLEHWLDLQLENVNKDQEYTSTCRALALLIHPEKWGTHFANWASQMDEENLEDLIEVPIDNRILFNLDTDDLQAILENIPADSYSFINLTEHLEKTPSGRKLLEGITITNKGQWSQFLSRYVDVTGISWPNWVVQQLHHAMGMNLPERVRLEAAIRLLFARNTSIMQEENLSETTQEEEIQETDSLPNASPHTGATENTHSSNTILSTSTSVVPEQVKETPCSEEAALHSKEVPTPEQVLDTAPAQLTPYIDCVRQAPKKPIEVGSWAKNYMTSEKTEIRCAVASCLLPLNGWLLAIPALKRGDTLSLYPPPMSYDHELRQESCPIELINLIKGMQQDKNPDVALLACASLLYRTGNCDQERFTALLSEFKKRQELAQKINDPWLSALEQSLGTIWERWASYRYDPDPFKLKANPHFLKNGVPELLKRLHPIANQSHKLSDRFRKKLNISDEGSSVEEYTPQDFTFSHLPISDQSSISPNQENKTTSPETYSTTDKSGDQTIERDDEDSPKPLDRNAVVQVEFFHQKGCNTCSRVQKELMRLQKIFPGLKIVEHDIGETASYERNDILCRRFGIARKLRHKAPALFAEGGTLFGEEAATETKLRDLIEGSIARQQEGNRLAIAPASPTPVQHTHTATPLPPIIKETPHNLTACNTERKNGADSILQESTPHETQLAQTSRFWETCHRYSLLALGGLICTGGLILLIFVRGGETEKTTNKKR